ncbi:hypothetical protein ASC90_06320 [Rhizobium sp. Root1220]|nr:hypothetical protein ASC90_06320 [Rhizobium sp. Root1220]
MKPAVPQNSAFNSVVQRDETGKFLRGFGGRPKGSKNRIAHETMKQIQDMRSDAIHQLWQLIMAGDFKAISYCLDRILPKERALELDDMRPATIGRMLEDGEIVPSEAKDLAATIKSLREIEDIEQLRAKLIELEAIVKDGSQR